MKFVSAFIFVLALSAFAGAQESAGPQPAAKPVLTQQKPMGQPVYQTNPPIPALPTKVEHQADFDAESQQANALFVAGKRLDALPLYEDLCRQDPTVALFAERHAVGLVARWSTPGIDPNASLSSFLQALNELHRAQSLGDNDLQVRATLTALEKTPMGAIITGIPLTVGYTYAGTPAAQTIMKQAEVAFAAQKFDEAAKDYIAAATQDPAWYRAALYAGESFFRTKDYADAGVWYAKAIAIDPDCETAYRYWGDTLYRAGNAAGARDKLVQAYVAEPYNLNAWAELFQWAAANNATLAAPQMGRPQFYLLNGKIDFDPHVMPETGDGRASWLIYQHVRVSHGATNVIQVLPPGGGTMADGTLNASGYIHNLAEEMDALNALLTDVKAKLAAGTVTDAKLDPGLKLLLQLQKDNMLECFVLLNAADMGLRHDYPRFRAAHRDQLIAYVNHYVLGQPAAGGPTPAVRTQP